MRNENIKQIEALFVKITNDFAFAKDNDIEELLEVLTGVQYDFAVRTEENACGILNNLGLTTIKKQS